MKSNNPVFNRSEEFNRASSNAYGNQTYAAGGAAYPGYGDTTSDPATWGTGTPGQVDQGRMTVDSVVQKTAISIALVFATAFATWWWIGDIVDTNVIDEEAWGRALTLSMLGAGAAFLLSLVNSFKRVISPALVMLFAAAEGVALGAISKVFDAQFGDGIVTQAVLGTFAAFAGTLAAYKFFDIKVGNKFRTFVIAGMFGMVGLGLLSLVLSFFGISTGLFGFGALGLVMSIAGLVLGVFMLILDFDFVENGVAAGLPDRESWRAAFGLTVSLVWIYTNLLRILAILRGD
ncbi:Bax inhibitor-1/YccA family protein [Nocardioides sp. zg-1308]|uniref:Bax inhibitor-1/YccA family protein n=1 Tax=Nocardioides renjunii TaxID=3095075 RepID=A0ABU5K7U7_9ACTN|nr:MULTISPECIES: Bax inhibitor-1/YccA family protein [unclassified Nocardioides]MDZ5660520.1 Bax inhibitor-1/YccA family protein [Nocardioides sp. S-58]NPD03637.1 Bax inhibitor-1/YccA family protein [Nocardioides sp. zg-1308]